MLTTASVPKPFKLFTVFISMKVFFSDIMIDDLESVVENVLVLKIINNISPLENQPRKPDPE